MSVDAKWAEVVRHLDDLYAAVDGLERIIPGRKFRLDGHLVGSIGEAVAAYMYDLTLNPASTQGHDAIAPDGRQVEIKLTQGKSIALRHEPEHLIALQRIRDGSTTVVYNGPGALMWHAVGKVGSNGQHRIGTGRLMALDEAVPSERRLPMVRSAPI